MFFFAAPGKVFPLYSVVPASGTPETYRSKREKTMSRLFSENPLRFLQEFPFPSQPALYNVHFWNPGVLSATFCAHLPELQACLDIIQESSPETLPDHFMILGDRGMGKSVFLHRLAHEIQNHTDTSSAWLALNLPEEQYTVSTMAELWCAVLLALEENLEKTDPAAPELADLKRLLVRMGELGTRRREEEAFAFLREVRKRRKQGLILCVDNTDLLLRGLASGDSPDEKNSRHSSVWRLRRILGREKGLFWIGSSRGPLENHPEAGEAFKKCFRYHQLLPLNVETMQKTMLTFAENFGMGPGISGEQAVKIMEKRIHEAPERLKVLRALTGGDPRSVVLLSKFFADGRKGNVQSDLAGLLDHKTPFYKTRLESLSEQPRKIAAHLMETWHPLSAKQLAKKADLPVTTVSGQLSRLENWGFVEKTPLANNRRNGFRISERLFNAWYLMRYASREKRERFRAFIEFMRLWLSKEKQYNLAQIQAVAHTAGDYPDLSRDQKGSPENQALVEDTRGEPCPDWRLPLFRKKIQEKLHLLLPQNPKPKVSMPLSSWQDRLNAIDTLLASCPHARTNPAQNRAWILDIKSSPSLDLEDKENIAEKCLELTDFQFHGIRQLLADEKKFMEAQLGYKDLESLQKAILSGKFFPDFPDPETVYNQANLLFQNEEGAFIYAILPLFEKENGRGFFVKGMEAAVAKKSRNAFFWNFLGNLWQHYIKNPQKAEEAYTKAIAINPNQAAFWNHLGTVLHYDLKRSGEAKEKYRQAILLDDRFSWPWNHLGNLFHYRTRDFKKAEEAYGNAIKLNPDDSLAWNNLGNLLLHRLERSEEAEKAYRNALALDEDNAVFWNNLGNILRYHIKTPGEAEDAYRKAILLDTRNPAFWYDLADLLAKDLARPEEARKAYEKSLEYDDKNAWIWTDLGDLLKNDLKLYDKAEEAYRKAIALNPNDAFPKIGLGNLLCGELQRYREAVALYEDAIDLDKEDPWAHAKLAAALAASGDMEGAKKNYLAAEMLAKSETWKESPAVMGILLQAALFQEKNSEAGAILQDFVTLSLREKEVFFRLKEQVRECQAVGLGKKLVSLMKENVFSDFLAPFIQSLEAKENNTHESFMSLAPEMAEMVQMVYDELFGQGTSPDQIRHLQK